MSEPRQAAETDVMRDIAHEGWIAGALAATLPGQVSFDEWWQKRKPKVIRRGVCSCGEVNKENRLGHRDGCRYFSDSVYDLVSRPEGER